MKKILPILILALCGCAHFECTQNEENPDGTIITTKIAGTAWFSSAQSITGVKAQNEKQSFNVGTFGQQGATNMVESLRLIYQIVDRISPK